MRSLSLSMVSSIAATRVFSSLTSEPWPALGGTQPIERRLSSSRPQKAGSFGGATPFSAGWASSPDLAEAEYHVAREKVLTEFELHYLSSLIERAGTNMSKAAKMAGIDRTTLYRLMEKHGLQRDTVIKSA